MSLSLIQFFNSERANDWDYWGLEVDGTIYALENFRLISWLHTTIGRVPEALAELRELALATGQIIDHTSSQILAPIDGTQEVWAAGVTYERSRAARQEESIDGGDVYARVYDAERPELFYKAAGRSVIAPYAAVGIRADATWSVPEAELAIIFNPAMEVVGFSIGNDMSSRDIEGENPLYLPQAKMYTASCALGPSIRLNESGVSEWPDTTISITIVRQGEAVFAGEVHTSRIKRTIPELADYLRRIYAHPYGVVLLTGTGVVPPSDFTLAEGDVVEISIDGIGTLTNPVRVV